MGKKAQKYQENGNLKSSGGPDLSYEKSLNFKRFQNFGSVKNFSRYAV